MDWGVVVFGRSLECSGAGPMDWMESAVTREEFESGCGQQPVLNCAAVEGTAFGLARLRSGGETIKSGLARALRIRASAGGNVYRERAL